MELKGLGHQAWSNRKGKKIGSIRDRLQVLILLGKKNGLDKIRTAFGIIEHIKLKGGFEDCPIGNTKLIPLIVLFVMR